MNTQRWRHLPHFTLTVTHIPPLAHAEVTTAPLLVVIGKNNTGKTRLLHLLWGVIALAETHILSLPKPENERSGPIEGAALALLHALKERLGTYTGEPLRFPLSAAWGEMLTRWFNEGLEQHKTALVQEILATEDKTTGTLSVSLPSWSTPPEVSVESDDAGLHITVGRRRLSTRKLLPAWTEDDYLRVAKMMCLEWQCGGYLTPARMRVEPTGLPFYLPASRQTVMQALPTFQSSSYGAEVFGKTAAERSRAQWGSVLSLPQRRLLEFLLMHPPPGQAQPEEGRVPALAELLERDVLKGKVPSEYHGLDGFRYEADGSAEPLTFAHASSLVGELAPLALMLRSPLPYTAVVVDEPESHLHLEAQRVLARVLIRLVNQGIPVWCSTHGDTFLQQLSLFLQLDWHPGADTLRERYHYLPEDSLPAAAVQEFELDGSEGRSKTITLKHGRYGVAGGTVGKSIADLSKEVNDFLDTEDELEELRAAE